ncbi:hypothetical protein D3C73_1038360 [compost metagenome]
MVYRFFQQIAQQRDIAIQAGELIQSFAEYVLLLESGHFLGILIEAYDPLIALHRPYNHSGMLDHIFKKLLLRMNHAPEPPDIHSNSDNSKQQEAQPDHDSGNHSAPDHRRIGIGMGEEILLVQLFKSTRAVQPLKPGINIREKLRRRLTYAIGHIYRV